MLAISAIVGVSTVGYLLDSAFKENEINELNGLNELNGNDYQWNYVESYDDVNTKNENHENHENNENHENKLNVPGNKISTDLNNNNQLTPTTIDSPSGITAYNNAGNPSSNYLINGTERPVEDFVVNNMVPFFRGSGTNQDMRGTGVSQANVNSDNLNLGNNNSTPYNTTLSQFTGTDDTYLHKREAGSFFSPKEQINKNTIPGEDASGKRHLRDRYTTSILTKNDEAPFERIRVGPGINVDADLPTDGQGYNSGISTKIRPSNVGVYNLTQLPGRIAGTKYQASNLPTSLPGTGPSFEGTSMYGVPNKKESLSSISTQEWRPMAATPATTQAPMYYSQQVLPSGTDRRTSTNVEFGQSIKTK